MPMVSPVTWLQADQFRLTHAEADRTSADSSTWQHWQQQYAVLMHAPTAIANSSDVPSGMSSNLPGQVTWVHPQASSVHMQIAHGWPRERTCMQDCAASWTGSTDVQQTSQPHIKQPPKFVNKRMCPTTAHAGICQFQPAGHPEVFAQPGPFVSLTFMEVPAVIESMTNQVAESTCSSSKQGALPELLLSDNEEEEGLSVDGPLHNGIGGLPSRRRRRQRGGQRRRGRVLLAPSSTETCTEALPEAQVAEIHQGNDLHDFCTVCTMQLDSGEEEQLSAAVGALRGMVCELSFKKQGCRMIQLALQVAPDAEGLANELQGHVRAAVDSPHANYVVQKMLEVLPAAKTTFIQKELLGFALYTAVHRYGCRIFNRHIEHQGSGQDSELVNELLDHVDEASRSVYGHHVISHVMEHGSSQQKKRITAALRCSGALHYAKHRHASYVLENVLAFADKDDQNAVAAELLDNPGNVAMLAACQSGCHIVKALVQNSGAFSQVAEAQLRDAAVGLQASKYGKRLLEELQLLPHC